ncbi:signal peptidase II [Wolbachia endosymbiont of Pentidionis agamae]|uniref:signal peptidase II n=1 Tax=Wolbachia endosymbiont of Pentidionis agamae TaxID=3110435 RepID=UPI002FD22461
MKSLYFITIIITALTDQISKFYINSLLKGDEFIEVSSFIKLVEVWNPGISFGLFSNLSYSYLLFSISSVLIICILVCLLYKSNDKITRIGFSFMIGGAIGNLFDRVYWKAVYDFIYFHIQGWYWPSFNLADVYIVCGMLLLLYKWYISDIFLANMKKDK